MSTYIIIEQQDLSYEGEGEEWQPVISANTAEGALASLLEAINADELDTETFYRAKTVQTEDGKTISSKEIN